MERAREVSITVGAKDLRQALLAVLPHARKASTDGDQRLARLRFVVTGQNLAVFATDAYTVGLAIVSVWDRDVDDDGDAEDAGLTWDLSAEAARKLLAVHKPVKVPGSGGEFEPEQTILVTLEHGENGEQLRTADISGLLPIGEELVLPVLAAEEQFPDIEGYLGEAVYEHQHLGAEYDGQPLLFSLAPFDAAVKAYSRPIAVRVAGHSRHRVLVTVGESFIGLVSVGHAVDKVTEQQEEVITAWDAWTRRLPQHMRRTTDVDDSWARGAGWETSPAPDEDHAPGEDTEPAEPIDTGTTETATNVRRLTAVKGND